MLYKILTPVDLYTVSYSNHYIFCQVYATDVLFSPLYTTPFLYVQIYIGVFADVMKSDTSCGSKAPHLEVGAFKSLQIWLVRRGVLLQLTCSVCLFLSYLTAVQS